MGRYAKTKNAARAALGHPYPTKARLSGKPTYLQRFGVTLKRLYLERGESSFSEETFLATLEELANQVGDILGPRTTTCLKHVEAILLSKGYLSKEDEQISLTEEAKTILENVNVDFSKYSYDSEIGRYHAECFLISHWLGPFKTPTRKDLYSTIEELRSWNEELLTEAQTHKEVCLGIRSTVDLPSEMDDRNESIKYMEPEQESLAPVAGPSSQPYMQTPVRKSVSPQNGINIPYPSPESLPRRNVSRETEVPSSPTPGDNFYGTDDSDEPDGYHMETDINPPFSATPTPSVQVQSQGVGTDDFSDLDDTADRRMSGNGWFKLCHHINRFAEVAHNTFMSAKEDFEMKLIQLCQTKDQEIAQLKIEKDSAVAELRDTRRAAREQRMNRLSLIAQQLALDDIAMPEINIERFS